MLQELLAQPDYASALRTSRALMAKSGVAFGADRVAEFWCGRLWSALSPQAKDSQCQLLDSAPSPPTAIRLAVLRNLDGSRRAGFVLAAAALTDFNQVVQATAARRLTSDWQGRCVTELVPFLLRAPADRKHVLYTVLEALRRVPLPAATRWALVVHGLESANVGLQAQAIEMAERADEKGAGEEFPAALSALRALLEQGPETTRVRAAAALIQRGWRTPGDAEVLRNALHRPAGMPPELVLQLATTRPKVLRAVAPQLVDLLGDGRPEFHFGRRAFLLPTTLGWEAVRVLAKLPAADRPAVMEKLGHAQGGAQLPAGLLLVEWGKPPREVRALLVAGLGHPSDFVKLLSLRHVSLCPDAPEIVDALLAMATAEWVGGRAAAQLPRMGKLATQRVRDVLQSPGRTWLKVALIGGIDASGVPLSKFHEALVYAATKDQSEVVRRDAGELLAE